MSDWTTVADFTFAQEDLWKAKIVSSTDEGDFKTVAEAPEDMLLNPEDYDITPEEIQVDNESWVLVTLTAANAPSTWTTVSSGTE
jgi:hypothetical protein